MRRLALLLSLAVLAVPATANAANPVIAAARKSATAKSTKLQLSARTSVPGASAVVLTGNGATSGRRITLHASTTVVGQRVQMDAIGMNEGGHYVMYMRS